MTDIVERLRSFRENVSNDMIPIYETPDVCIEAADEITRLRAENEELRESLEEWRLDFNSLRADSKALRTDAARYRWLRSNYRTSLDLLDVVQYHTPEDLDAAVDAAIRARKT